MDALNDRARMSIELAMTADARDPLLHGQQEARAKAIGMSGAEIDAARRGWSFDVQTSVAVALATVPGRDQQRRREQIERALHAGFSENVCRDIEALASRFGT